MGVDQRAGFESQNRVIVIDTCASISVGRCIYLIWNGRAVGRRHVASRRDISAANE